VKEMGHACLDSRRCITWWGVWWRREAIVSMDLEFLTYKEMHRTNKFG